MRVTYNVGEIRIPEVGLQHAARDTGFFHLSILPSLGCGCHFEGCRMAAPPPGVGPSSREEDGEGEEGKDTEFVPCYQEGTSSWRSRIQLTSAYISRDKTESHVHRYQGMWGGIFNRTLCSPEQLQAPSVDTYGEWEGSY